MVLLQVQTLGILAAFTAVGDAGPFYYGPSDPRDPELVALVRQALTTDGINPNGIDIKEIFQKEWLFGISYKVTYVNAEGVTCSFHFRYQRVFGLDVQEMPHCDSREIGLPGGIDCDDGNCGGPGSDLGPRKVEEKITIQTQRDLKSHTKDKVRDK